MQEDINYRKWENIFGLHIESAQKSNFCKSKYKKSFLKSAQAWQANLEITAFFGFNMKFAQK